MSQNRENAENECLIQESMIRTIDRMADGLSAMSAIVRCGSAVSSCSEGEAAQTGSMRSAPKDCVRTRNVFAAAGLKSFSGVLTELDKVAGTCRLRLIDETCPTRISADIVDPCFQLEKDNAYIKSFVNETPLSFKAKVLLDKEGNITKFVIIDAED